MALTSEELVPSTRVVQVGEVTIRKVVVTETRTIEVPIRREEVIVERLVLNEALAAPLGNRLGRTMNDSADVETTTDLGADEEIIRVPVLEEQVVIEKRPVVREEVRILKRRVRDVARISEEVRHEEPVSEGTSAGANLAPEIAANLASETQPVPDPVRQYQ
jgi:uncharacterized protein (TIGR02271 family)